jgi:hypothetical protein
VIAGIDQATYNTDVFKIKLTAALTTSLGLGPGTVVVDKIAYNMPAAVSSGGGSSSGGYIRRNLLADFITVNYHVSAMNMLAAKLESAVMAAASTGSLTMQLRSNGYMNADASAQPTYIDISPATMPTMSPNGMVSSAQVLSSPLLFIASIVALAMLLLGN